MKYIVYFLLMLFSMSAGAWTLISDPVPNSGADPVPTDCRFYFDAAQPVKIAVQQCTDAAKCPAADGTTKGTGYLRCFIDLGTVTLANGSHAVQATHYVSHPVSPAESVKSNTVTFTWPIPQVPNVPAAPGFLRLSP